jgi:hypothetical protein
VRHREGGEGQQVLGGVTQQHLQLGELAAQHPGDDVELVMHAPDDHRRVLAVLAFLRA